MMLPPLYCHGCDADVAHEPIGSDAACTSCGTVREVDPELLAGVVDMERCPHCRWTHPVGQKCDPTPCLRKTGLWPCGTCEACLAAQASDLARQSARRAEFEHGSRSDLRLPEETP